MKNRKPLFSKMALRFLTKALKIIHKVFVIKRLTIHSFQILLCLPESSLRPIADLVCVEAIYDFALASCKPLKVSQSIRIIPRSIHKTANLTPWYM